MTPEDYFSFESTFLFEPNEVVTALTEEFVLEGEAALSAQGIDTANIYFTLLAQLKYVEEQALEDAAALSHVNYLIAYYVGLFLHPFHGDAIALSYATTALAQASDAKTRAKIHELIAMINEEL